MRILATTLFFDTTYIFFFLSSKMSFFSLLKQDAYTVNVGFVGGGGYGGREGGKDRGEAGDKVKRRET